MYHSVKKNFKIIICRVFVSSKCFMKNNECMIQIPPLEFVVKSMRIHEMQSKPMILNTRLCNPLVISNLPSLFCMNA